MDKILAKEKLEDAEVKEFGQFRSKTERLYTYIDEYDQAI